MSTSGDVKSVGDRMGKKLFHLLLRMPMLFPLQLQLEFFHLNSASAIINVINGMRHDALKRRPDSYSEKVFI